MAREVGECLVMTQEGLKDSDRGLVGDVFIEDASADLLVEVSRGNAVHIAGYICGDDMPPSRQRAMLRDVATFDTVSPRTRALLRGADKMTRRPEFQGRMGIASWY